MSIGKCKGCLAREQMQVRQMRIYSSSKQFQFRIVLCHKCFGGLLDLIRLSSDGMTEGLWNPIPPAGHEFWSDTGS